MCENSAVSYSDGEVVWVKLGSCWWPGEVVAIDKIPTDVLPSLRKPPIAVVKFFQEDAYEFIKNSNFIDKYECSRKNEFICKGLHLFRNKHGHMEKFPEDVIRAETAIGGDIDILTRDEFQEKKKESYAGLFGDAAKKTPGSIKKGKRARGKLAESPMTPLRKNLEKCDYKVHILLQGSKTPTENITQVTESIETPSCSAKQESENQEECEPTPEIEKTNDAEKSTPSTAIISNSGIYSCHACPFTTQRLNVLILHNKTHSVSFMPYTPSPVKKKVTVKLASKSTCDLTKTPKVRKPRKEKVKKEPQKVPPPIKKRVAEGQLNNSESKKVKTDEEIKSSLLADWDDGDEESNDESLPMIMAGSPEVPQAAESPAVPTSAELTTIPIISEISSPIQKKVSNSSSEAEKSDKAEASSDSKYEFCEDEDWPLEADVGRKIPRVKNPKRKEDTKSMSIDDDEIAREVAELLNKTTVPDLPSAPEPLKTEENFPEPSIVKSPDKEKSPEKSVEKIPEVPTKAIFKTKTFFRSRHSRSQDAIGKYVAEQLNAVERMDIAECEINGSEAASSPEMRDSPPIEQVKVARLAPKIQLKKMKLEAAQLREKERNNLDYFGDFDINPYGELLAPNTTNQVPQPDKVLAVTKEPCKVMQDVLYPTQEIKPVNTDITDQIKSPTKFVDDSGAIQKFNEHTTGKCFVKQDLDNNYVIKEPENAKEIDNKTNTVQHKELNQETYEIVQEIESDDVRQERKMQNHEQKSQDKHIIEETIAEQVIPELIAEKVVQESITDNFKITIVNKVIQDPSADNVIQDSTTNKVSEELNVDDIQKPDITNNVEISDTCNIIKEPENKAIIILNQAVTDSVNIIQGTDNELHKTCEETVDPFMNKSTASAVDALLSVSRETDRVTKIISDDPPEDLFEDDNKDGNVSYNEVNDFNICKNIEDDGKYSHSADKINDTFSNNLTPCDKSEDNVESILDSNNISATTNSVSSNVIDTVPSESDLQIAETLINLPSTAIQNKASGDHQTENILLSNEPIQDEINQPTAEKFLDKNENLPQAQKTIAPKSKSLLISNNENVRYETEQEKSENLNAAQSLVQMSESIDLKINIDHNLGNTVNNNKDLAISDTSAFNIKPNNGVDNTCKTDHKIEAMGSDDVISNTNGQNIKIDTSISKLLKILEEPCTPKSSINKSAYAQQSIVTGKEKILNFDVAKSSFKGKNDLPKQKIIIRRSTPSKNTINNITDITKPEKIILSRSKNPALDSSVQTYTIQTTPDPPTDKNALIIQQKIINKKIAKPPMKLQKIKPQNSLVVPVPEAKVKNEVTTDETMFDINSMPIVLSEDLLTPENIEKMPIVMSDGNIITQSQHPPKLIKTKQHVETDKVAISATPNKSEVKTLLMNPVSEVPKVTTTPNILSKSSKLRAAKPMLVIDKTTGKQKIIMTKGDSTIKEVKQPSTVVQNLSPNTGKTEKFLILPSPSSPRPGRTQKIVIDPQTGKAHVLVAKGPETQLTSVDNKPVSAKLIASSTDTGTTGNTVMIITNAQGAQSRIVLTPEHEKMLFPKKQQPNVSQLKTIAHRISTNAGVTSKSIVTSIAPAKPQNVAPVKTQTIALVKSQNVPSAKTQNIAMAKTQTRIVPKQKSAIITSKGQLIVGGRVATTAQNIAPMPEIRPVPKRIIATEPKKLVQAIQKSSPEPLIFLQQKSGSVMQLTAAQFEHLQRTGQIVHRTQAPAPEKVILQKTITMSTTDPVLTTVQKPRARKNLSESPAPLKKLKHEKPIAPAPMSLMPVLSPFSNVAATSIVPSFSNTVSISTTSTYSELDNFEELLPSTAIARQPEPVVTPAASPVIESQPQLAATPATPLSEGGLIALPGEHFGGPPGSFYLCVEDSGAYTPIDHRPLVLENNQLVPMSDPLPVLGTQPERRDILEAALANSDVFHAETTREETHIYRNINPNVSVSCQLSETSTTLNQPPIMTPVEVPTKVDAEPAILANIEDGLAVIGVTPHMVPTSLELPITITDPRIAPKTTDPLSSTSPYGTAAGLLQSPNTEMTFITTEETEVPMTGPISMPLLTDDESVGKSMPILTDDVAERTVSSVDSTIGSPSPTDVRESENEDSSHWTRLLTPNSDTSEASAEIPLQPAIQLSVNELARKS